MNPDLVTAFAAVVGAVAVLITSISALVVSLRTNRKVDVVHEVVNSRATAQDDRIAQLTASITGAGLVVPLKPTAIVVVPEATAERLTAELAASGVVMSGPSSVVVVPQEATVVARDEKDTP